MQALAKITSKAQITVPKTVRERLGLSSGDVLLFEVGEDEVRVRKAPSVDTGYLSAVQATLGEWDSPEDDEAYADLRPL